MKDLIEACEIRIALQKRIIGFLKIEQDDYYSKTDRTWRVLRDRIETEEDCLREMERALRKVVEESR